jgi:hypothetical protein
MVGSPRIDPHRPLIICDADEVLIEFIKGLERFLERQDLLLDLKSFRIHGNVRHRDGTTVADERVTRLIDEFFAADTAILEPVPGAAEALAGLQAHAQILILSNLPASARDARATNLAGHGMEYPVMAGSGPKGNVILPLIADMRAPVVFVDDLPPHHASVASVTPHVQRLHFVADTRLASLVPPSPHAHARIDTWPEAAIWIRQAISGVREPV